MTVTTIKAYAKINLALDILGKRSDGYHEMNMVMQSVDWYDEVNIRRCPEGIQLVTGRDDLPADESNLAYRAAQALRKACALSDGVYITLHKKIPLAAGMAGGSSDAAAVLIGMNNFFELGLSLAKLEKIAAGIGSDVAFCLRGGTQLATGRGEIMTPLPDLPDCWVVLAKLPISVSTAWAFGHYSPDLVPGYPAVSRMIKALHERNLAVVADCGGNVLETVTLAAYPEVAVLKQTMLTFDPLLCLMSGSGPTVFALMAEREKALRMVQTLKKQEELFGAMVKNVVGRKL